MCQELVLDLVLALFVALSLPLELSFAFVSGVACPSGHACLRNAASSRLGLWAFWRSASRPIPCLDRKVKHDIEIASQG